MRSMPFIWGSTFWDVAMTNRRLLAVQFLVLPVLHHRTILSVPWVEVTQSELRIYTGMPAVILRLETADLNEDFKLLYAAADYRHIEDAMRRVVPTLRLKTGTFRVAS